VIGPIPDFPTLLRQVSPHMGPKTDTLPVLDAVYFEADTRYLYAIATDSYTLAVARRRIEHSEADFRVRVQADDLKAVRAAVRLTGHREVTLALGSDADGPRLRADTGGHRIDVPCDLNTFTGAGGWRKLLTKALAAAESRRELRLNPRMLGRWQHAARTEPLTVWSTGADKPLVVAGPDFLGLHMPVRSYPESPYGPKEICNDWTESLGATPLPARRRAA
jgi:hypothetical protein